MCNLFLPLWIYWSIDVWVTDLPPHLVPGGAKSLRSVVMLGPRLGLVWFSDGVMVVFGVPGGGIVPFSWGEMLGPNLLVRLRQVQM